VGNEAIKIGEEFGSLTVVRRLGRNKQGKVEYLTRCECGSFLTVLWGDLKSGDVFSCGCPPKAAESQEQLPSFFSDYPVVEFFERLAGGKVQAIARDGRILDERPMPRGEMRGC